MASSHPSTSYAPYQSHRRNGSTSASGSASGSTSSPSPSPLKPPPPLRRLASGSASTSANHVGQQLPSRNLNGSVASTSTATLPAQVQRLRLGASGSAGPSSSPTTSSTPNGHHAQPQPKPRNDSAGIPSRTSSGRSTPVIAGSGSTNEAISSPVRTTPRHGHHATPSTSSVISTAEALRIRNAAGTRTPTPTSIQGISGDVVPPSQPQRFQPRGTTRSRLADFVEARNDRKRKRRGGNAATQSDDTARYEERIQRRVDKLLSIHDPNTDLASESSTSTPAPTSSRILSTLAPHSRFLTTLRTASTLRSLEQSLVPWQPDEAALECPICKQSFGYGRRKHHCRACGRVVCADVSGAGERCSGNVVASENTRGIQDAPSETQSLEEILNGSSGNTQTSSRSTAPSPFRLCQECKRIIHRTQYMSTTDSSTDSLPLYVRLYDDLTTLQLEIEQRLPEFQELILGLQRLDDDSNPATTTTLRDASSARKQLLSNFASYDSLSKQIRAVGLQDPALLRLTSAIERKAAAFLQANMFPLQSIPTSRHSQSIPTNKKKEKGDTEKQAQLAVLMEQKEQIQTFLARAQRERMLNDVPLLRANLDELEREMDRVRGA